MLSCSYDVIFCDNGCSWFLSLMLVFGLVYYSDVMLFVFSWSACNSAIFCAIFVVDRKVSSCDGRCIDC